MSKLLSLLDVSEWSQFCREYDVCEVDLSRLLGEDDAIVGKVDCTERQGEMVYWLDVPGVPRGEIKITEEGCDLVVCASRPESKTEEPRLRKERWHGTFTRRLRLPPNAERKDIRAHLEDGVLQITVPKLQAVKPAEASREIPIT